MAGDEFTEIVGSDGKPHRIPLARADDFFHADSGRPLTDEEYDETKRRLQADNIDLVPAEFRE